MLDMLDAMVMTLDLDGRIIEMNRACEQLTQYRADEVRNKPLWSALAAPEDAEMLEAVFRGARAGAGPQRVRRLRAGQGRHAAAGGLVAEGLVHGTGADDPHDRNGPDGAGGDQGGAGEAQDAERADQRHVGSLVQLVFRAVAAGRPGPLAGGSRPARGRRRGPGAHHGRPARDRRRGPLGPERAAASAARIATGKPIAPMTDGVMPPPQEFFEVDCWDISLGGIAFFLDQSPEFQSLVVALGRPPALNYFTAQVVRVARMEQRGHMRYLVGCRFLERAAIDRLARFRELNRVPRF